MITIEQVRAFAASPDVKKFPKKWRGYDVYEQVWTQSKNGKAPDVEKPTVYLVKDDQIRESLPEEGLEFYSECYWTFEEDEEDENCKI